MYIPVQLEALSSDLQCSRRNAAISISGFHMVSVHDGWPMRVLSVIADELVCLMMTLQDTEASRSCCCVEHEHTHVYVYACMITRSPLLQSVSHTWLCACHSAADVNKHHGHASHTNILANVLPVRMASLSAFACDYTSACHERYQVPYAWGWPPTGRGCTELYMSAPLSASQLQGTAPGLYAWQSSSTAAVAAW